MDNPKIPRQTAAPLTLLIGDLVSKGLAYAEHLDFILSIRDARFATMFEIFIDYAWWIIAIFSALWVAYEWRKHKDDPNPNVSLGALVFSSSFVAFLLGVILTVKATGSLPEVVQSYAADPIKKTCNASIDTSRLEGFKDDYRIILICGAADPSKDAQEDERISISSTFHITGLVVGITGKFGRMEEVWKDLHPGPGQVVSTMVWHSVALVPKETDPATIKKVSDVPRVAGRFITQPADVYGSSLVILNPASPQTPER